MYRKYDLATANNSPFNDMNRYGQNHLYGINDGINSKDLKNFTSRSWHPSPFVSDISDDEQDFDDQDLSVEEKTAKVRAEIRRRRQRLADSDRLYRHYSFDDYNCLNNNNNNNDRSLLDDDNDPLDSSFNYLISQSSDQPTFSYDKYSGLNDNYSLLESKEKYYSDEYVVSFENQCFHFIFFILN